MVGFLEADSILEILLQVTFKGLGGICKEMREEVLQSYEFSRSGRFC
jgi:hypothetical protein